MSLRDRANGQVRHKGPQSCAFGTWLATLGEDDRAEVIDCVRDREVSATGLARELQDSYEAPEQVSRQAVNHHRKGSCATCRPIFPKETT